MTVPTSEPESVVVRLGVSGELGQMDFPTVLRVLAGSYELLQRTARRVVGDRAEGLTWQLSGLKEGSAMTLVRAVETDEISGSSFARSSIPTPEI
jgi:hypothetical protein